MEQHIYVVIGSKSRYNCKETFRPDSLDTDVICSYDAYKLLVEYFKTKNTLLVCYPVGASNMVIKYKTPENTVGIIECEVWYSMQDLAYSIWSYVNNEVETWDGYTLPHFKTKHAPRNVLYMLKMSHRYKKNSPHFARTRADILALRKAGAEITGYLNDLYIQRMSETYNYAHPKLNVSKKYFFTDNVPYVYDHDSIHEAIAIDDVPAYTHFATGEVMFSNKAFLAADRRLQLLAGLEEASVLALERSIIPYKTKPLDAFKMALEKVSTSITSGPFREFCWENFDAILDMFDGDAMMKKFEEGLANGVVVPFKSAEKTEE